MTGTLSLSSILKHRGHSGHGDVAGGPMVTFSRRTFGVAADPAWVGSLWRRIIDHAHDAILHERRVEVEQEPHAATGEAQVGEQLRLSP